MTLPIVEEITALPSQAERADWLLRCPDWHVIGSVANIRRALELSFFPEAVAYLDVRHASLQAVRTTDGSLPQTVLMGLNYSRLAMLGAAKERDGTRAKPGQIGGGDLSREGQSATPREGDGGTAKGGGA